MRIWKGWGHLRHGENSGREEKPDRSISEGSYFLHEKTFANSRFLQVPAGCDGPQGLPNYFD